MDAWLAYRILCAGLVPVNDLGTQAYEYYCRVDRMVSRISWPTLLTRFRERKEVISLLYKFRDVSIRSVVPLFVPNLDPSNSIAILLLHSVSVPWIVLCKYWIWMRLPAPTRGPAHTSLLRGIVFVAVDHWSARGMSHPICLNIVSTISRTSGDSGSSLTPP